MSKKYKLSATKAKYKPSLACFCSSFLLSQGLRNSARDNRKTLTTASSSAWCLGSFFFLSFLIEMLQWTIGKLLLLPPKCFCVHLFLLSLGDEVLQGTIGKHSLLVHAFPKCFCCAIVFFFPLEKKCFKRQIRKHSLCMHLPKCFCCASVSSFPWRRIASRDK